MPCNRRHHDDEAKLRCTLPGSHDDQRVTVTTKPTNPVAIQGDDAIVK